MAPPAPSDPPTPEAGARRRRLALDAACALLALGATLWFARSFFGHAWPEGHRYEFHLVRTLLLADGWRAGALVPRWLPELSAGLGSPLFVYYGWLSYAPAAALNLWGLDAATACNVVLVAALLVQAAGAWALGHELGGRAGGFVAWALFGFAPYLLVDLFVRANYPEVVAGALAPLALVTLVRAARGRARASTLAGAAACAAIVLCHNLTAAITLPAVAAAGLGFALASPREERRAAVLRVAGALALALGLSALFWLPLAAGRHDVQLHRIFQGYYHYAHHFVYPAQLLDETPRWGASVEGPDDGMPFPYGRAQALATLAALVVAVRFPARRAAALGFVGGGVALVFLTTTWSAPVWSALAPLQVVHFPWLLFLPASLLLAAAGAVAAAPLFDALDAHLARRPALRRLVAPTVALALAASTAPLAAPRRLLEASDATLRSSVTEKYVTTACSDEYRPTATTDGAALDDMLGRETALLDGVPLPEAQLPPWGARRQMRLEVRAPHAGALAIPVFWFPGWRVEVDGRRVAARACPGSGVICAPVGAGTHVVEARLETTRVQRAGEALSAASLLLALALAIRARARRARRHLSNLPDRG